MLPSGLRLIGSTLWSLVAEDEIDSYSEMLTAHGLQGVDDIRLGERFLTLRDTNELHAAARAFLAGHCAACPRGSRPDHRLHALLADAAAMDAAGSPSTAR